MHPKMSSTIWRPFWPEEMFCCMHATPSHYDRHADLFIRNKHKGWKLYRRAQVLVGYILSRVCLKCSQFLAVTFSIFFTICGVVCTLKWRFKFRWPRGYICNSSYYHHQIGSINLSHYCHIFPWLCVWVVCTIICCRFHIYPGKAGGVSFIIVQS